MKTTIDKHTFLDGFEFMSYLPKEYKLIEDNAAPYRLIWLDEKSRKIVTYCEGDIIICSFDTDEELQKEITALKKFYGRLLIEEGGEP